MGYGLGLLLSACYRKGGGTGWAIDLGENSTENGQSDENL